MTKLVLMLVLALGLVLPATPKPVCIKFEKYEDQDSCKFGENVVQSTFVTPDAKDGVSLTDIYMSPVLNGTCYGRSTTSAVAITEIECFARVLQRYNVVGGNHVPLSSVSSLGSCILYERGDAGNKANCAIPKFKSCIAAAKNGGDHDLNECKYVAANADACECYQGAADQCKFRLDPDNHKADTTVVYKCTEFVDNEVTSKPTTSPTWSPTKSPLEEGAPSQSPVLSPTQSPTPLRNSEPTSSPTTDPGSPDGKSDSGDDELLAIVLPGVAGFIGIFALGIVCWRRRSDKYRGGSKPEATAREVGSFSSFDSEHSTLSPLPSKAAYAIAEPIPVATLLSPVSEEHNETSNGMSSNRSSQSSTADNGAGSRPLTLLSPVQREELENFLRAHDDTLDNEVALREKVDKLASTYRRSDLARALYVRYKELPPSLSNYMP